MIATDLEKKLVETYVRKDNPNREFSLNECALYGSGVNFPDHYKSYKKIKK